jgi:hypothetical protein
VGDIIAEAGVPDGYLGPDRGEDLDLSQRQQEEVLKFVESLRRQGGSKGPRKSLLGIWKGFEISSEDIDQVRREMWTTFPRADI